VPSPVAFSFFFFSFAWFFPFSFGFLFDTIFAHMLASEERISFMLSLFFWRGSFAATSHRYQSGTVAFYAAWCEQMQAS
jgi:hypothetical protein